jgi:hypothetical protein
MHYVHGREDTNFGSGNQVETGTHTSAIRGISDADAPRTIYSIMVLGRYWNPL